MISSQLRLGDAVISTRQRFSRVLQLSKICLGIYYDDDDDGNA
jgi:hypothetical protein